MEHLRSALRESTVESTEVMHEYDISGGERVFRGYALRASRNVIESVLDTEEVEYAELNQEVHAIQETCNRQNEATWVSFLTLTVSQRDLSLNACVYFWFLNYNKLLMCCNGKHADCVEWHWLVCIVIFFASVLKE